MLPLPLMPSPQGYLELNGCALQCIFLPVSITLQISEHPAKQFPEFLSLSAHFQVAYVIFLLPLFHKVSLRSDEGQEDDQRAGEPPLLGHGLFLVGCLYMASPKML